MEAMEKLIKDIKKTKEIYLEVEKRYEETKDFMDHVYLHESRNSIEGLNQLYTMFKEGILSEEDLIDAIPNIQKQIKMQKEIDKIPQLHGLCEEKLRTGQSNLKEIFNIYKEGFEFSENISANISGFIGYVNLNPIAMSTLISMNYGDAVKWIPEEKLIYANFSKNKNNLEIKIENETHDSPIRNIGLGKKLGTEYTNKLIETLGGKIEIYQTPTLFKTENKSYGKKFTIPLK
jgi:hypothetical protein